MVILPGYPGSGSDWWNSSSGWSEAKRQGIAGASKTAADGRVYRLHPSGGGRTCGRLFYGKCVEECRAGFRKAAWKGGGYV